MSRSSISLEERSIVADLKGNGIEVLKIGTVDYNEALAIQRELHSKLLKKEVSESIIICQHPPTITLGRAAKREHILVTSEHLKAIGIRVHETDRGGDVTYHGPGQIVAYPILNLSTRKRDVGWYMRLLEQAVINTLEVFEISSKRNPGKTGVWIQDSQNSNNSVNEMKKISFIGVKLSKWHSLHGLSLNVRNVPGALSLESAFSLINPCGLGNITVTSVERELGSCPSDKSITESLVNSLLKLL